MNAPERVIDSGSENQTPYTRRARYFSDENGFTFRWPAVPARQFLAERDRAFDAATPTRMIALDSSDALGTPYLATTPTLLLRYLKIRAGETLRTAFVASGEICYVLKGSGESRNASDTIAWSEGDLFCFPGGGETTHRAGALDCLLYCGTNEPLLAYDRLRAPLAGQALVEATHWPAAEIERQLQPAFARPVSDNSTGQFVQFSSAALAPSNNSLATIGVAINSVRPGGTQRAHRHNGVAVTLALHGDGVHSMIDGQRIDWSTGAAQITPPAALHSHHNLGAERARSLIFQDEALHYYTRTPGFSFD
jgi:gentisate 1,2-dioxygenase